LGMIFFLRKLQQKPRTALYGPNKYVTENLVRLRRDRAFHAGK